MMILVMKGETIVEREEDAEVILVEAGRVAVTALAAERAEA